MKTHEQLIRVCIWLSISIAAAMCTKETYAQVLPEYSAFPKSSIGFQIGTQGLGLQGSVSVAKSFNIRMGFITIPDVNFLYNSRNLRIDRDAVYAIADWQPRFGNSDWFSRKWFVSAGVGYYFSNTLYRQGYNSSLPDYSISMAKLRPYIGTGLGNIHLWNDISLRLDLGDYIPTSAPVSSYENKAETITRGLNGILPGLNTAATLYIKF